ncbi:sensor histidine kinase [Sedimentibacter sp. MB31-C6]|uniref:sensor histidine kinase n=1 Tax=Sedimentibacter sp. MB31-C6 TaxID=3109366 RepID=UPI002DDD3C8C|nr:GHKL domain-containing protein [Sedimentibacter sp. MB36-C1]WSI05215.1 GHKL domain-containing protein [Sedimentibacter sp. MB36-C1]
MNKMQIIIFELLINLFESYLMIDFISKFNGYRYNKIKRNILFVFAILILFVEVSIANYIESFIEIPSYVALIVMIIYSIIALEGKFIEKLMSCITFNVVVILINSFSLFIFSMIFNVSVDNMITTFGIYRIVSLVASKILLFYVSRIILKLKINKYKYDKIHSTSWILTTLLPLLTIFVMVTITETEVLNNDMRINVYLFLSIVGLILINIIFYYLFVKLGQEYEISTENELLKRNLMLQNKHSWEIKELYNEIQAMRHDMRNQIICILSYIQDENYEKGVQYINSIIKDINNTKKFIFTKNDMFNAIVNNKLSEANSNGIKTSYIINYELDNFMEERDINILFGNLLDNAIEACDKLKGDKEISLLIDKKRDYILIKVKNTIDKSVLKDNPNLLTTKFNKSNHGMGLKSIKKIIKKYDGIINYYEKDNMFSCNILLLEEKVTKSYN